MHSVKVGRIDDLFWELNGFDRPLHIPDTSGFKEINRIKVNWDSKHAGTIKLEGDHWNYMEFKGRYFFLTKGRLFDVSQNIYLYAITEDFWVTYLTLNDISITGNLIKTNDEELINRNINLTDRPEGTFNRCITVNVSSETDLVKRNTINLTGQKLGKFSDSFVKQSNDGTLLTVEQALYTEEAFNAFCNPRNPNSAKVGDIVSLLLPLQGYDWKQAFSLRLRAFLERAAEGELKLIEVDFNEAPYKALKHIGDLINKDNNLDDLSNVPHYALIDGNSSLLRGKESLTYYIDNLPVPESLDFKLFQLKGYEIPEEYKVEAKPKWYKASDFDEIFKFDGNLRRIISEKFDPKDLDIGGLRVVPLEYSPTPVDYSKTRNLNKVHIKPYRIEGMGELPVYDEEKKKWSPYVFGTLKPRWSLVKAYAREGKTFEEIKRAWFSDNGDDVIIKGLRPGQNINHGQNFAWKILNKDRQLVESSVPYKPLAPILAVRRSAGGFEFMKIRYEICNSTNVTNVKYDPADEKILEESKDKVKEILPPDGEFGINIMDHFGFDEAYIIDRIEDFNAVFRYLCDAAYSIWYQTPAQGDKWSLWKSHFNFKREVGTHQNTNTGTVYTYENGVARYKVTDDLAFTGTDYVYRHAGTIGKVIRDQDYNKLKFTDIPGFSDSDLDWTSDGRRKFKSIGLQSNRQYEDPYYPDWKNLGYWHFIIELSHTHKIAFTYSRGSSKGLSFYIGTGSTYIDTTTIPGKKIVTWGGAAWIYDQLYKLEKWPGKTFSNWDGIKAEIEKQKNSGNLINLVGGNIAYISPKVFKSKEAWLLEPLGMPYYIFYSYKNEVEKFELILKDKSLLKRRTYKDINLYQAPLLPEVIERINTKLVLNVLGKEYDLNYRLGTLDDYKNIQITLTDLKHPSQAKIYDSEQDKFIDDEKVDVNLTTKYFNVIIKTPYDYIEDIITIAKTHPVPTLDEFIKYEQFKQQQAALNAQIKHSETMAELADKRYAEQLNRDRFDKQLNRSAYAWTKRGLTQLVDIGAGVINTITGFGMAKSMKMAPAAAEGANFYTKYASQLHKTQAVTQLGQALMNAATSNIEHHWQSQEADRALEIQRDIEKQELIASRLKMNADHHNQEAALLRAYYEQCYSQKIKTVNDWDVFNMYRKTYDLTPVFLRVYTLEGERKQRLKDIALRYGYGISIPEHTHNRKDLKGGDIIQFGDVLNVKGAPDTVTKEMIKVIFMNGVRIRDNSSPTVEGGAVQGS